MVGKISYKLLQEYVFNRIGIRRKEVLVGPSIGEDAAIIDFGDKVLVIHTDPITEAVERIGWLAINIACNDVAVRGAKPLWASVTILLPEGYSKEILDEIARDIDEAAKNLGVMVIGGHTEETPRLDRPIVIVTAMGMASKSTLVITSGSKPGDLVIMTKTAGLEGTAIIARDFRDLLLEKGVSEEVINRAAEMLWDISVVREALLLAWLGATSMHDPTEGGILGGLIEMSIASGNAFKIYEDKIPLAEETKIISEALGIDPLKLISSGVLLATIPKDKANEILGFLEEAEVKTSVIGEVVEGKGVYLVRREGIEVYQDFVVDEIARLWSVAGIQT
ncbi:MAG TPA: hydrogenase assembly protein HupF [Desulfurococcaceae archaeon]|nr:hydrogenase assembly protein HupF [Desulfurococcaceae archaeon]